MQVMTTVKVSVPEVMVHGQFSGICWQSSISSQLEDYSQDFVAFTMYLNST